MLVLAPHCLFAGCLALLSGGSAGAEKGSPPNVDVSGWDWGEVEAVDDTPLSPNRVIRRDVTQVGSVRLTLEQSVTPDLGAQPRAAYRLFPDMPDVEVIPSRHDREMHPCSSCHQWVESNPSPRPLQKPHDNFRLEHGLHGKGGFWCFTCHELSGSGSLKTLEGEALEFSDAYVLCSQCHVDQTRDWAFGAHGKRVETWRGQRRIYNCTVCHYQHGPAWKKRTARAGPVMRQGLQRPVHWQPGDRKRTRPFEHELRWQRVGTPDGSDS